MVALDHHRSGVERPARPPAKTAPKRLPTRVTALAHVRVREVSAVIEGRTRDGVVFDHLGAARVLANALAVIYRDGGDMLMVEKLAKDLDTDAAITALNETDRVASVAGPSYRLMKAGKAGERLGLTLDEVTDLKIRTMWPVDETAAQRAVRRSEAKRKADRERARAKRGREPRAAFLAKALTASRPWEADGVSRRTWERRRAAGKLVAGMSRTVSVGDLVNGVTPATSGSAEEHYDAAP